MNELENQKIWARVTALESNRYAHSEILKRLLDRVERLEQELDRTRGPS